MDSQTVYNANNAKNAEEEKLFLKQQKLRQVWFEITRQMEKIKQYRDECEIERLYIDACRQAQETDTFYNDGDLLAYTKQVFQADKELEKAQCRIYRIEDKLAYNKKSDRERIAEAIEGRKMAKTYAQEVFDKAQLSISLGQGQIYPERGRYSIPRTTRADNYKF
jgi:hypothetical protein